MSRPAETALTIKDLQVSIDDTPVVRGVSLSVRPGEIHALMGPNGSGKSTTAYTLAGHPAYEVTGGSVTLGSVDVLEMSPDERAQAGLFLAFQYPIEVPGVRVERFLREAHRARFGQKSDTEFPKMLAFRHYLESLAQEYGVELHLLRRGLNEGFSGGEKKRLEVLQMAVLQPRVAILDETDSGLDIDAIKIVAAGVKKIITSYNTGVIIITHYQRILEYIAPDQVHVMINGRIAAQGGSELVTQLESAGYAPFMEEKL